MLKINNLFVSVDNKEIVKGVSLAIHSGEIHALMGPNGSGKSSLAMAIAGHPKYNVKSSITLDETNIADKTPDERARMGLFLASQYPTGVDGVTVEQLLRRVVQEKSKIPIPDSKKLDILKFRKDLEKLAKKVGVNRELLFRSVNVGFSGGEKKRLEILQMLVLEPKYAILDETDSGLDVDALKTIAKMIKIARWSDGSKPGVLVITHYAKLLQHLNPNFVHIMKEGKIVESGSMDVVRRIEKRGYRLEG